MKESGVAINTFSVDYADNKNHFKAGTFQPTEDAPYVSEMREFLQSKHHDVILDTQSLFGSLNHAVIARGLPGMADVDSSLYLFCEKVSEKFKYALSGECADETGCIRWGVGWRVARGILTGNARKIIIPHFCHKFNNLYIFFIKVRLLPS